MMPISLIVGFLGSGKTTFLSGVARRHPGRRWLFLVNEFSRADIDGERLRQWTPHVQAVTGGSIFCRCLVTEFIQVLNAVASSPGTAAPAWEGVVIEASGMANPKVIEPMLRETRLDKVFRLAAIIAMVDPGSFHKLRQMLPAITAQIEAADTVILNKTDLYSPAVLEQTEAALREIKPALSLRRAVRGDVVLDLFPPSAPPRGLQGDYAPCRDPRYATFTLGLEQNLDLRRLQEGFQRFGEAIYRAKGWVLVDGILQTLDYSSAGLEVAPAAMATPSRQQQIVFVVQGGAEEAMRPRLQEWLA